MMTVLQAVGLICIGLVSKWAYDVCCSLFFSPLRDIPGPLSLQLFPSYEVILSILGKFSWKEREYHLQYGPVYRKGRNTVQFSSEEALREIYATQSYRKSDMYLFFQGEAPTSFSSIDKDFHRKRKRIMAPAFSLKEIESHCPVIREKGVDVLMSVLREKCQHDSKVDIYAKFKSLTLDLIGVLGFGTELNTLTKGPHPLETWFFQANLRVMFEMFLPLLRHCSNPPENKLDRFTLDAIDGVRGDPQNHSIMASLIKAVDPETGSKLTDRELVEEAKVQIFAGSDSTANSMTWALYFILKNPQVYKKIVSELDLAFPSPSSIITLADCKPGRLPYFEACIKESMRVVPAAAGTLERVVPSGGRTIDGYFLPEGTIVGLNALTLHTLPSIWGEDSTEFRPERWLNREESGAFIPFSVGPRACIGRELALAEIRLTLSTLLRQFDLQLISESQTLTPFAMVFTQPHEDEFFINATPRVS